MEPSRTSRPPGIGTGITSVERLAEIDTLVWEGARLIVRAPREMPAWRVGRNRKIAIHFRGVRYTVVAARTGGGGYEYVLDPWPVRAHELPSQDVIYDETYVRDRESDARAHARARREAWAILPLWPLLGFLPSPWKRALHRRYGFEPTAVTRFSVWAELSLVGILFAFVITGIASGFQLCVFAACLVDGFFRGSLTFDDEAPPVGFFEWLVRPSVISHIRTAWAAIITRMRGRDD
jgi:hypothetical protein